MSGAAGNPLCQLRTYRVAVATALLQVRELDGRQLSAERAATATPGGSKGAFALQHLAAMQLQAFQQVCSLPCHLLHYILTESPQIAQ